MKKILITGADSFIGTSFQTYIAPWGERYETETVATKGSAWQDKSFAGYDTVFHVAGIAHSDTGKISEEKAKLYYEINTALTVAIAKKAKAEGVHQFVFMSSAIVYGDSAPIGKEKIITKDTPAAPANCYGDSKLQAENGILPLEDSSFHVAILRPPMIYGKGCKGNYPVLAGFAKKLPFFPYVQNRRSMLYIENLCEFVRLLIENEESGIFWPQNAEYSNTSLMVADIASVHGKKIFLLRGCTWVLHIAKHFTGLVNKAFGNLCYAQELSLYKEEYRMKNLKDSIRATEK